MSKKAKKATKEKRLIQKRAKKAANKARWEKLRLAGQNSKSKRFIKANSRSKKAKTIDHLNGQCGNIACKKCDPGKIWSRRAA